MASDLQNRVEYAAYAGLIGVIKLLPFRQRKEALSWLCRKIVGPVTGYRKRALKNLDLIYPDRSREEKAAIADRVLDEFGRSTAENASYPELIPHIQAHEIGGPGLEVALKAKAEGRPIVFSSGHWSNHEATRIKLYDLGFDVGAIYRPMKNPHFNARYVREASPVAGPTFPIGREGTRGFVDHLKAGHSGILLHDVFFPRGKQVPFLGQPAWTSFAPADFARMTGALLIPFFGTRNPDGHTFTIELEAPVPQGSSEEMMRDLMGRLEARIEADPGQWFWIHRRWKDKR
ncbi:MAG: lysophospholipid acyltransferase family protein [Shimia sp.]